MRYKIIFFLIVSITLILLVRVYFLSIKSNTYYEELSKQNYIKRIYDAPSRGIIKDRNGVALAINNLGFSLKVKPHLRSVKNMEILEKICDAIVKEFPNFDKDDLIKKYKKLDSPYSHTYVQIVDYIPYSEFFEKYTKFSLMDNVEIEPSLKRYYPYNEIAAHIIGYVGKASQTEVDNNTLSKYSGIIGKNGLEKYYNDTLQGELGYKDVKVNALNKEIEVLEEKKSGGDNNLKTTLDIELQKYIHEIFNEDSGAVVVMEIKTGAILAAASFPEYDNNVFVNGITTEQWDELRSNLDHPFTNKVVNGLYPPGSVWKMGVALSFLENGISPNFNVNCTSSLQLGKRNFRCWKEHGHGNVDFNRAIRESCDDFFYKGSLKVGINKISKTMEKLGFGEKSGVDQINEFIGVNPNKNWKNDKYKQPWYIGETVISSIGQGYVLVTPMQIARYTAALVTNTLVTPHFSEKNFHEPISLNFEQSGLDMVKKGMYEVVNHPNGTASKNIHSKVTVAAKTGTAQVVGIPQSEKKRMKEHELEYYQRSHAWLTTFGPYKDPKYVVTAIIEHGGHGGSAAGDMVSKIYDKLYELGYITELE